MLKYVIKNLLLVVVVRHNVTIKLSFQLEAHRFDIYNIIPDLNWWCYRDLTVLLHTILARLCNKIAEFQQGFFAACPTDPAFVRT